MRARTVREGSVGLLIIVGMLLFVGIAAWLRNFSLNNNNYKLIVEFANIAGMQIGATVRYRGFQVGKITGITPTTNGVDVSIEITQRDLKMPHDVIVEANQSGFIGETAIDINPKPNTTLPADIKENPFDSNCSQSKIILCHQARLHGEIGSNFDELLRSTIRFSNAYSDPKFYKDFNQLIKNSSDATIKIAELTRELSSLTRSAKQNLTTFSTATNSLTQSATKTASKIGNTADKFGSTADKFTSTAAEMNKLVVSLNSLVGENRATLIGTLNNFSETSKQLRDTVNSLKPLVTQASTTLNRVSSGELLHNLEIFSANAAKASENAAQASANLRDVSKTLKNPASLLILQRTLDSARVTFENAQKITSDLDKLTGDPAFVNNLRNLVNGLSKLVSSTQQIEQQISIAQALEPVSIEINQKLYSKTWVDSILSNSKNDTQLPIKPSATVKQENPEIKSKSLPQPASNNVVTEQIKPDTQIENKK